MLPRILWLWLPLGFFLISTIGEQFASQEIVAWLGSEGSPYELIQFAIMVIALAIAVFVLFKMDHQRRWLMAYMGIAAIACLYVAGEEISWGQHLLDWRTPEFWSSINDQNETNLHNTSSWLDQKPRILLIIGVYMGGLIIPLLMRVRPSALPQRFSVLYPTSQFAVTALICLFAKLSDKIGDATDYYVYWRGAENEELFIYYFVMIYLLLMAQRLVPAKATDKATDGAAD
ncbi:MAG: hypothetical protein AAF213_07595 [Pseudomonadota bacterium]